MSLTFGRDLLSECLDAGYFASVIVVAGVAACLSATHVDATENRQLET